MKQLEIKNARKGIKLQYFSAFFYRDLLDFKEELPPNIVELKNILGVEAMGIIDYEDDDNRIILGVTLQ